MTFLGSFTCFVYKEVDDDVDDEVDEDDDIVYAATDARKPNLESF